MRVDLSYACGSFVRWALEADGLTDDERDFFDLTPTLVTYDSFPLPFDFLDPEPELRADLLLVSAHVDPVLAEASTRTYLLPGHVAYALRHAHTDAAALDRSEGFTHTLQSLTLSTDLSLLFDSPAEAELTLSLWLPGGSTPFSSFAAALDAARRTLESS